MPGSAGPNLGLVYGYSVADVGWGITGYNPGFRLLDTVVHLEVLSRALSTPPGSPVAGDRYIVGGSPTGAWSGHTNAIARWSGSAWEFTAPKSSWRGFDVNTGVFVYYTGSAWAAESTRDTPIANGEIEANISGSSAAATGVSLSGLLDAVISNTQGALVTRKASGWDDIAPGITHEALFAGGAGVDLVWRKPAIGDLADIAAQRLLGNGDSIAAGVVTIEIGSGLTLTSSGTLLTTGVGSALLPLTNGDTATPLILFDPLGQCIGVPV